MARKRQRLGRSTFATADARRYVRMGAGSADIVSRLAEDYPTLALSQIRQIADREEYRQTVRRDILNTPLWQFTRPERMAHCGTTGDRVRIKISIRYIDQSTGLPERFDHTTDLRAGKRAGDILNQAIADVIREARERGYNPPDILAGDRFGANTWDIDYAECY